MAKQKRSQQKSYALPKSGMQLGNASGLGVIDSTTLQLPPTSLAEWFSDAAAVEAFSQPAKPRM